MKRQTGGNSCRPGNRWLADHEEYLRLVRKHEEDQKAESYDALVKQVLETNHTSSATAENLLHMLVKGNEKEAEEAGHQAETQAALSKSVSIICLLVGVLVAILLAVFITRSITKPLQNIFKGLKSFSTQELAETGEKFRMMIEAMQQGAEQVASAAGQVASAGQSLSQGSSEQAAAVEETTSSIEEMACMTKQNAGNANGRQ